MPWNTKPPMLRLGRAEDDHSRDMNFVDSLMSCNSLPLREAQDPDRDLYTSAALSTTAHT